MEPIYYAMPIDKNGNVLGDKEYIRPLKNAGCPRDARYTRLRIIEGKGQPEPVGMLVVLSETPYKDLDEFDDEFEYWIFDENGWNCSPGEGPKDPFA